MHDRLPPDQLHATCKTMEAVARCGPVRQADIVRRTGLPPGLVSDALSELLSRGWIHEPGGGALGASLANVTYEEAPEAAAIAVVDLGGTNVRVAISDWSGNLRSQHRQSTDPRGGVHVTQQVAQLCRSASEHDGIPFGRVGIAAVGVPGVPDRETGRVRMAPNIDGLDRFDVRAALHGALGIDTVLENDVNAALLGEHWAGENRGIDNLVYVNVGTGLGAGILCNGALIRGFKGAAGQISAVPIGADPEDPESLRAGALERVTAGAGIRRHYQALSGSDANVAAIFDRAADGDSAAMAALDEAARNIALGLGATCAMIDPEKIILGGSIGCRREIVDRVAATLARIHPDPAPVVPETPDFEAALLGCAHLGLQHLAASLFGDLATP